MLGHARTVFVAAIIPLWVALSVGPVTAQDSPPPPRDAGLLGSALSAATAGDWDTARSVSDRVGPVARRLVDWLFLRDGPTDLAAYDRFLTDHGHWPLARRLQRDAESLLTTADPAQVRRFFSDRAPLTDEGKLALAFALLETDRSAAEAIAQDLWRGATLSEAAEARLLAAFGPVLADLHRARVDALLWNGARRAAERNLSRLDDDHVALAPRAGRCAAVERRTSRRRTQPVPAGR
ncbi:MAG: hypothetical protein GVY34_01565 [Alphaproteobacteria bacterium]|nr:hypothetical protein [Alphaproteobacteria bacterium]